MGAAALPMQPFRLLGGQPKAARLRGRFLKGRNSRMPVRKPNTNKRPDTKPGLLFVLRWAQSHGVRQ
ncbi:MAG: hypothetical protein C5B59_09220 [Bacteroidetes bacterium]|nr:MAG: hypothetical protein C5B59_09220 [Bacteroidota bacterium]